MRILRFIALFALLLVARAGAESNGESQDLQPKTYSSPSGEWVLLVDPSARSGAGPAEYTMKRAGQVAWSGTRPFTLWEAAVANDGRVGGYSYSQGLDAWPRNLFHRNQSSPYPYLGEFTVFLIDAKGSPRQIDATPRVESRVEDGKPIPNGLGVFIDPGNDRFVVRLTDSETKHSTPWWVYRLSDGRLMARFDPKARIRGERHWDSVLDARPILHTPLTLVNWWKQGAFDSKHIDGRFVLLDLQGKPVWNLDLRDDYGNARSDIDFYREINKHGAILDASQPGRFDVREVKAQKRVTFAVERGARNGWSVRQIASSPYGARVEDQPKAAESRVLTLEPKRLGSIELKEPVVAGDASPVHDVYDFTIDDLGRFGFLTGCDCTSKQSFVVVDRDGALVREVALPALPKGSNASRHGAWIKGDRWVVTTSGSGEGAKSSAVWVDGATGAVTPVIGFAAAPITSLASSHDGGFVALTTRDEGSTSTSALSAFDDQGRMRWTVGEDIGDDTKLFSPESVTVTGANQVVVLGNIDDKLRIYGIDGHHVRTVDLEKAWGRKPNYPSGLRADAGGGVIVNDFEGSPPIVRMALDGKTLGSMTPMFSDQHRFDIRGDVQIDPDGRLWTSDGHALLRLDGNGVVDRVLGPKPDPDHLGDIAALTVDPEGRIYVADERTGAVHVFDDKGTRMRVDHPDATDYKGALSLPSLTASARGEVYISRHDFRDFDQPADFLHYAASGARAGVESIKLDSEVSQHWFFQNGSDNRWVLGYLNVYLVDATGRVLRTIERTASHMWLEVPGPVAVAPDGSIAVLSGAHRLNEYRDSPPITVTLYSPKGDPIASWPAPADLDKTVDSNVAYNGMQLAFLEKSRSPEDALSAMITDSQGKPLYRFPLRSNPYRTKLFLMQREVGRELWVYDGNRTIDRYALH